MCCIERFLPNCGDLWWVPIGCGGLQWFAVVCSGLRYSASRKQNGGPLTRRLDWGENLSKNIINTLQNLKRHFRLHFLLLNPTVDANFVPYMLKRLLGDWYVGVVMRLSHLSDRHWQRLATSEFISCFAERIWYWPTNFSMINITSFSNPYVHLTWVSAGDLNRRRKRKWNIPWQHHGTWNKLRQK